MDITLYLSHSDNAWVNLVQEVISKHEVDNSVNVYTDIEVFMITTRKTSADAMVTIEHACDPIKAEAVKAKCLHEVAQIGQQKPQDFPPEASAKTRQQTDSNSNTNKKKQKSNQQQQQMEKKNTDADTYLL